MIEKSVDRIKTGKLYSKKVNKHRPHKTTKFYIMPNLKIQEAQLLFNKIRSNPKGYDLKTSTEGITGKDDKISFKLYKSGEKSIFEVTIDGLTFSNSTGEWNNAMIMLENIINKLGKETENIKVQQALDKLKKYLSEEN